MVTKKKSIFAIVFLAFALQSAQVQAFSFGSFVQSVYSWISEKPQFAIGATFLGLIAYLYFSAPEKKDQKDSTHEPAKPDIIKIDVKNQGSNLQCGYYALRNGFIALDNNRHNQTLSIKDDRFIDPKDSDIILEQEAWDTILNNWKNTVLIKRKKTALKEDLEGKFFASLKPQEEDDVLWEPYRGTLSSLAVAIANETVEIFGLDNNSPTPQKYTSEELSERLNNIILQDNFAEMLLDSKDSYLENFSNLSLDITSVEVNKLCKNKYKNVTENIDGDELKEVLKATTNIEELQNHFTICEDIEQLSISENSDTAKKLWHDKPNYMHIFLIGTMKEEDKTEGHWFMVAAQKRNNQKTLYSADSLNIDRTDDVRMQKIIEFLEG